MGIDPAGLFVIAIVTFGVKAVADGIIAVADLLDRLRGRTATRSA